MKDFINKYGFQALGVIGLILAGVGEMLKDKADNIEMDKKLDEKIEQKLSNLK